MIRLKYVPYLIGGKKNWRYTTGNGMKHLITNFGSMRAAELL